MKSKIPQNSAACAGCQVVFFDVGETLVAPYPSFVGIIAEVCAAHGYPLSEAAIVDAAPNLSLAFSGDIPGQPPYRTTADYGRRFWEWVYATTLASLHVDAPSLPAAICATFEDPDRYRLFPDVRETLEALRAEGLRLGIISNWEPWLPELLESLEIAQLFDCVTVSGIVGHHKPDVAIFHAALDMLGIAPEIAVHVGDSLSHDYHGAARAGLHAVLLDRHDKHAGTVNCRIRSLLELPGLLAVRDP